MESEQLTVQRADGSALFVPLSDLGKEDVKRAGGKGANLGELLRAGLPVLPGFVVTADAYTQAMAKGGVRGDLRTLFDEACAAERDAGVQPDTARMRDLVRKAGVPVAVRDAVLEAYHSLGDNVPVAVHSSATEEDTAGASFAGMHDTIANVVGDDALLARLADCWASLYGDRAVAYRISQRMTTEPVIAVVVQQLVDAERSGVMFTADPSTSDTSRIVIEAAYGLGEVVGGQVEPDTYVVEKHGSHGEPEVLSVRVGHKTHKLVTGPGGDVQRVELQPPESGGRVLRGNMPIQLAYLGRWVEEHYGEPQDIEWAMDNGATYLVQSRPITTLRSAPAATGAGEDVQSGETAGSDRAAEPLVRGLGASAGTQGRCAASSLQQRATGCCAVTS